jgi:CrcB protein
MKEILFVFLGGGLGSLSRYGIGKWINTLPLFSFPLTTLVVNVFASLVLGFVVGMVDYKQMLSSSARIFWVIGFCGGFSTFSAFSFDSYNLLQEQQHWTMLLSIFSNIVLCFGAILLGIYLSERLY